MIINNYFLISFLIILIINILNFGKHHCNTIPCMFNYNNNNYNNNNNNNTDIGICSLSFKTGSLHWFDYHIHHWLIGIFLLCLSLLFKETFIIHIIQGISVSIIIDGLLFSDRFIF